MVPVYGAVVLNCQFHGGSDERGHGGHDRFGEERADFDGRATFDLDRTERSRCKTDTASSNRQHGEGEYGALSDEKQLTHGQLLSCKSPNVVTWQGSDCSLGQWVWSNSLSAGYVCTELLPVAA